MLSDEEVDENNLNFSTSIIWEDSLSIPEMVKKLALLKHEHQRMYPVTRHATLQLEFHQTTPNL